MIPPLQTVFAPTNEAFAALPAGVLDNLLKPENKAQLVDILTYHVVAGNVQSRNLTNGELVPTVEGKNVSVNIEAVGGVYLNIGTSPGAHAVGPRGPHTQQLESILPAPCQRDSVMLAQGTRMCPSPVLRLSAP